MDRNDTSRYTADQYYRTDTSLCTMATAATTVWVRLDNLYSAPKTEKQSIVKFQYER